MSVRVEHLQQGGELRGALQEGLRSYGSSWLERRLASLNKLQLVAVGVAMNVTVSSDMLKKDIAELVLRKFEFMEPVFDLQCVVREGGASALREKLEGIRVTELRSIAAQIGLPVVGLKRDLVTNVFNHVSSQDVVS